MPRHRLRLRSDVSIGVLTSGLLGGLLLRRRALDEADREEPGVTAGLGVSSSGVAGACRCGEAGGDSNASANSARVFGVGSRER